MVGTTNKHHYEQLVLEIRKRAALLSTTNFQFEAAVPRTTTKKKHHNTKSDDYTRRYSLEKGTSSAARSTTASVSFLFEGSTANKKNTSTHTNMSEHSQAELMLLVVGFVHQSSHSYPLLEYFLHRIKGSRQRLQALLLFTMGCSCSSHPLCSAQHSTAQQSITPSTQYSSPAQHSR